MSSKYSELLALVLGFLLLPVAAAAASFWCSPGMLMILQQGYILQASSHASQSA
jgi:hypothetical protein